MVHGGGGHHRHSRGASAPARNSHSRSVTPHHEHRSGGPQNWGGWNNQWGRWVSPPVNQSVVVINNSNTPYQNYRAAPATRKNSSSEDCCRKCELACCTCCFITAASSGPQKCGSLIHWVFLSVCFFILLVVLSHVNESWTLNGGETRRIQTKPILTKCIEIQSQVGNGMLVYDIAGACPPLTGPTIALNETWQLHLAPDDYQYDYYYLTRGSTLQVTFYQNYGATDILILKGTSLLHNVESGEDFPSFASQALFTRYTAAAGHHRSPPTHFTYTVPESDVYIIVYDNASSSSGRARAMIHVDLATYDLANQVALSKKYCQALTCTVDTKRNMCLLIQASGPDIVTVHVSAKRNWLAISLIALIPIGIALVLRMLQGRHQEPAAGNNESMLPPATNPEATLLTERSDITADYESIPIVASSDVVPVAVPIDDVFPVPVPVDET